MTATIQDSKLGDRLFLTPRVPQGLAAAVEGLTREVIRQRPENIYVFAAHHFEKLLRLREQYDDSMIDKKNAKLLQGMNEATKERNTHVKAKDTDDCMLNSGWSLNETAKVLDRHRSIFGERGQKITTDEVRELANESIMTSSKAHESPKKKTDRFNVTNKSVTEKYAASSSHRRRESPHMIPHDTPGRSRHESRNAPRIISQIPLAKDIKTELKRNRISSKERKRVDEKKMQVACEYSREVTIEKTSRRSTERTKRGYETRSEQRKSSRTESSTRKKVETSANNKTESPKLKSSRSMSMDRVKNYVVQNFAGMTSLDELQTPSYVEKVQEVIDETSTIIMEKVEALKTGVVKARTKQLSKERSSSSDERSKASNKFVDNRKKSPGSAEDTVSKTLLANAENSQSMEDVDEVPEDQPVESKVSDNSNEDNDSKISLPVVRPPSSKSTSRSLSARSDSDGLVLPPISPESTKSPKVKEELVLPVLSPPRSITETTNATVETAEKVGLTVEEEFQDSLNVTPDPFYPPQRPDSLETSEIIEHSDSSGRVSPLETLKDKLLEIEEVQKRIEGVLDDNASSEDKKESVIVGTAKIQDKLLEIQESEKRIEQILDSQASAVGSPEPANSDIKSKLQELEEVEKRIQDIFVSETDKENSNETSSTKTTVKDDDGNKWDENTSRESEKQDVEIKNNSSGSSDVAASNGDKKTYISSPPRTARALSPYSYILTEGSPHEIPDTVTTVIIPDRLPSPDSDTLQVESENTAIYSILVSPKTVNISDATEDNVDSLKEEKDNVSIHDAFGEAVDTENVETSTVDVEFIRNIKANHDKMVTRQDLGLIQEERDEETGEAEVTDSEDEKVLKVVTSSLEDILEKDKVEYVMKEEVEVTEQKILKEEIEVTEEKILTEEVEVTEEKILTEVIEVTEEKIIKEEVEVTGEKIFTEEVEETEEKILTEEVKVTEDKTSTEEVEETEEKILTEKVKVTEDKTSTEEVEETEEKILTEEVKVTEDKTSTEEVEETEEKILTEEVKVTEDKTLTEKIEVSEKEVSTEEVKVTEEKILTEEVEVAEKEVSTEEVKVTEEKILTEDIEVAGKKVSTEAVEVAENKTSNDKVGDLSPEAVRATESESSDETKETSITDGAVENTEAIENSLDIEETTARSAESTNEIKETSITTDRSSLSFDPAGPVVPELNLDSLPDLTISSFNITDDEQKGNKDKNDSKDTSSPDLRLSSSDTKGSSSDDKKTPEELPRETSADESNKQEGENIIERAADQSSDESKIIAMTLVEELLEESNIERMETEEYEKLEKSLISNKSESASDMIIKATESQFTLAADETKAETPTTVEQTNQHSDTMTEASPAHSAAQVVNASAAATTPADINNIVYDEANENKQTTHHQNTADSSSLSRELESSSGVAQLADSTSRASSQCTTTRRLDSDEHSIKTNADECNRCHDAEATIPEEEQPPATIGADKSADHHADDDEKKEYHIFVPEMSASKGASESSSSDSSTFMSAATKIQAGVRGFLTRRRLQSSQRRSSTLDSVSSIQESFVDESSVPADIVAATTATSSKTAASPTLLSPIVETPSSPSDPKSRKKLRREDAVQRTTLSVENAFAENQLQHTGEFHDCIPLPVFDAAALSLKSHRAKVPVDASDTSSGDDSVKANEVEQLLGKLLLGHAAAAATTNFPGPSNLGPFVDMVLLPGDTEAMLQSRYLNFITSVEDVVTNELFDGDPDTPKGVIIEELTSLDESKSMTAAAAGSGNAVSDNTAASEDSISAGKSNNNDSTSDELIPQQTNQNDDVVAGNTAKSDDQSSGKKLEEAGLLAPAEENSRTGEAAKNAIASPSPRPEAVSEVEEASSFVEASITSEEPLSMNIEEVLGLGDGSGRRDKSAMGMMTVVAGEMIKSPVTMMQVDTKSAGEIKDGEAGELSIEADTPKENESSDDKKPSDANDPAS